MRVEQQDAYVLHTRPYRDSSLIADVLTKDHGRIALVAKGVRASKNNQRQLLQPFVPLSISWYGKNQLKSLAGVESTNTMANLAKEFLYSGFYANELLLYVLAQDDPVEEVFFLYHKLLMCLQARQSLEVSLRDFEFSLLNSLGYGVDFTCDSNTGGVLIETNYYRFLPDFGFVEAQVGGSPAFLGSHILSIADGNYQDDAVRQSAKRIARLAFEPHLQGKTIKSRALFV